MKNVFKLVLTAVLVCSLMFSYVSCTEESGPKVDADGFISYTDLGLNFRLPENMKQKNVQYAAIFFTDGKADFFVNVFENEVIRDNWYLREGFTVSEYTDRFIVENNYKCDFEYDEEKNVATFGVHYPIYESSDEPPEYYYHYITQEGSAVYIVIMSCPEEDFETYSPEFIKWQAFLSVG